MRRETLPFSPTASPILRLYGPTEPALAKTWKPGDVEKVI